MKFVYTDEETGELVVTDLSPEQAEMTSGFYDLSKVAGMCEPYTNGKGWWHVPGCDHVEWEPEFYDHA